MSNEMFKIIQEQYQLISPLVMSKSVKKTCQKQKRPIFSISAYSWLHLIRTNIFKKG